MPIYTARLLVLLLSFISLDGHAKEISSPIKSVSETVPVTMANIHGQKTLYQDGWFVISSTEKALEYAKRHSIDQSQAAIKKLSLDASTHSIDYVGDIDRDIEKSAKTIKHVYAAGTHKSKAILQETHNIAQQQWELSGTSASNAWSTFSNGYIYLSERTAESRKGFANLPGEYLAGMDEDFRALGENITAFNQSTSFDIQQHWADAFDSAQAEFRQAYAQSAESSNSATGLWTLLGGYASSLWQGLIKPSAQSTWQITAASAVIAGEMIFLPVASTYIITKNTLQTTGMAIYYSGKTAVELVSPTIEGGFLAGVSLLSAGSIPVTYVAGTSIGVINQVATSVAAPVIGTAQGVVSGTGHTVKYGALLAYDAVSATTKVFLNQIKSGVVLGYNALTALPSQLVLTSVNTAYFILMDGPKLVIASVQGKVHLNNNDADQAKSFNAGVLPVGTVMDLKALQQRSDVKIEIVGDEPEVIEKVIEQLAKDLKQ